MTYAKFVGGIVFACLINVCVPVMAADATNAQSPATDATQASRTALAQKARTELETDILPYWLAHAPDPAGGFYGRVDRKGKPDSREERGALLTARILWTFSAAYRHNGDPACLDMARRACADLEKRFHDPDFGGYYWAVKADGKVLDSRKLLYGQAFCIYALSEYYRASGDKAALDRAVELYTLVEEKCRDRVHGGYLEVFSRDWKFMRDDGFESFGPTPVRKTQNTHLHVLEAYTNLLRARPDEKLRADLAALHDVMLEKIYNPATHHLFVFLGENWKPIPSYYSYGHDIEFSWLIVEAAEVLDDPARLAKARAAAVDVARTTLAEGVDKDGGIFNEGGPKGPDTGSNKDWWPQAEAVIGFVNAWRISGDPAFLQAAEHTWDFIDAKFVDHKYGEWFRTVRRDGRPTWDPQDKIGFWKCPYHNGRACMELMDRLAAPNDKN